MMKGQDRGNKKWTALVLPEHRTMLIHLHKEQTQIETPFLDEHQYEQIDKAIRTAVITKEWVTFTLGTK